MADLDLSPHPLVVGLGVALASKKTGEARRTEAREAAELAHGATARTEETKDDSGAAADWVNTVAIDLAADANIPELAAFGGYLGGTTKGPPGESPWQILYLDAKLLTWLLVQHDEILYHQRMADDKAAFSMRDVIWVRADALVGRSTGSPSAWLSGSFTRAVEFTPPLTGGGGSSAATGIFCEVATPACCPPRTR